MDQTEKLYQTAQILESQNNIDAALDCYREIAEIRPTATSCYNLGIKLYESGHIDEAAKSFCYAIHFNPKDSDAYYNLGLAIFAQKKYRESIVCFEKALKYGDNHAHTYYCIGIAFQSLKEISKTIHYCQKTVIIDPFHLQAHLSLGYIYKKQGDTKKAISYYREAQKIAPDSTEIFFTLANLHKGQKNSNYALNCYQQIIALDPLNAKAYKESGIVLHNQGYHKEAIEHFKKSLSITPDSGLEVRSALTLPVINDSQTSIEFYRQRLLNKLDQLTDSDLLLKDPLKEVDNTCFLLAYHGLNDKNIQQKIAAFYLNACPSLEWSSPHCEKLQAPKSKIKIGFISTFLFSHTIAHLFFGIIEQLSKKKFHLTVFRFQGNKDPMSTAIDQAADEVFTLPYKLDEAREIIAESTLQILFYLDIGMEPITYFLAFSRLAPVQCKRGHPVTSGIPNLDYFISCDKAETHDAEQHYSEQLVRLTTYGYYYYPPRIPTPLKQRIDFGLPLDATLYVCPQTLFKFHPDFDCIFGEILHKDPHGILVLIEGREDNWSKLLLDRFAQTFSDKLARIIVLPRMSNPDFLSLCILADAVLDSPGFSGGKISLDCFALSVPIITLPSPYMRGRLTLAQYDLMGITDCIAGNKLHFIELAIKLANNKLWKTKIIEKIRQRSHVLFKNIESVKELELFFATAVEQTYSPNKRSRDNYSVLHNGKA